MLTAHRPLTMVALSRQLGTTAHNVTKLVDWLEAEGFVERRRDVRDRWAVLLHVTSKSVDVERRFAQPHEAAVAERCCDLPDPQLDQLTALLGQLRAAMQRRLSSRE